jgi:hypothetical protein
MRSSTRFIRDSWSRWSAASSISAIGYSCSLPECFVELPSILHLTSLLVPAGNGIHEFMGGVSCPGLPAVLWEADT